jgi:hypothetical protein
MEQNPHIFLFVHEVPDVQIKYRKNLGMVFTAREKLKQLICHNGN